MQFRSYRLAGFREVLSMSSRGPHLHVSVYLLRDLVSFLLPNKARQNTVNSHKEPQVQAHTLRGTRDPVPTPIRSHISKLPRQEVDPAGFWGLGVYDFRVPEDLGGLYYT